jgi:aspartyl-tRNA(Asn)/glutamyl-tRNA(Gln) amidotransferase subunit B
MNAGKGFETIIGLEIHIELGAKSKMFCRCNNRGEDAPPNTTVCEVCLGHPGTLPVPNARAIEYTAKLGLALDGTVNPRSRFERKSYFYPDLPKGYQITQYMEPLVTGGSLTLPSSGRSIRIERIHLEEDTAKTVKVGDRLQVDYNRSGTPLLELVTEPDLRTPAEAKEFASELQLLAKTLRISDAEMQKGHLRIDANVSLRRVGDTDLNPKVEVKNINSFKFLERALVFEVERQGALWEEGTEPVQETRGWDEASGTTLSQRTKEEAADYRYFPEPDLPPLVLDPALITQWLGELPETTHQRRARLTGLGFAAHHIEQFLGSPEALAYAEAALAEGESWARAKKMDWMKHEKPFAKELGNWIFNRYEPALAAFGDVKQRWEVPTAENTAEFLWFVLEGKLRGPNAVKLFNDMVRTGKGPHALFREGNYDASTSAADLKTVAQKVIADNPAVVEQYRSGKTSTLQFFVGKLMAETKGAADAAEVRSVLEELLRH